MPLQLECELLTAWQLAGGEDDGGGRSADSNLADGKRGAQRAGLWPGRPAGTDDKVSMQTIEDFRSYNSYSSFADVS